MIAAASLPERVERPLQVFDLFDRAWQTSQFPDLQSFLDLGRRSGLDECGTLEELIKIDLEYRWRAPDTTMKAGAFSSLPLRPHLEDYGRLYPRVLESDGPSAALIVEEYRVRQCWGDKPS